MSTITGIPARGRVFLQPGEQRKPVQPGHDAVGDDRDIGRRAPDPFQGFHTIACRGDFVLERFEGGPQKAQHRGTVVNHEHARGGVLVVQGEFK